MIRTKEGSKSLNFNYNLRRNNYERQVIGYGKRNQYNVKIKP